MFHNWGEIPTPSQSDHLTSEEKLTFPYRQTAIYQTHSPNPAFCKAVTLANETYTSDIVNGRRNTR